MLFEKEIKAALGKAGLAESLADQITIKTVDEIEGAILALKTDTDRLKGMSESEFLAAIKSAGLDDSLKGYVQREFDRRVTDAIQKHDEKLKKAAEDAAKKKDDDKAKETMTEEQKRIQSLEEANKALAERLDGLSTTITTGNMDAKLRAELKKSGLSEEFSAYVTVTDPEKVADAVSDFKAKLDAHQQTVIDKKLEAGEFAPVKKGGAGQTVEESNIAEYAKSLGKGGAVKNPDFLGKISSAEPVTADTKG